MFAAVIALCGPPRAIRRQLQQRRKMVQLLTPIGEMRRHSCAIEPAPLPHCIVSILKREFRNLRPRTAAELLIKGRDLPVEYPDGPCVGSNMVHCQQQYILVVTDP